MTLRWLRVWSTIAGRRSRIGALALLGIAAAAGSRPAAAQLGLQFRHLSTDDGLMSTWTDRIYQDSRGFMWLGSRNGLDRYDGNSVVSYRHQREDSTTLADNDIAFITEDRDSTLWIGTRFGPSRFDRNTGAFTNMTIGTPDAPLPALSMVDTRDRVMVVGVDGALYRLDRTTGTFIPYFPKINAMLAGTRVIFLLEDRRAHLWIGTSGAGLIDLDPATGAVRRFIDTPANSDASPADEIRGIVEDGAGSIWVGTSHHGLVRLNPVTGAVGYFHHDAKNSQSLASDAVTAIALNGTEGLWIGIEDGGVDRLDFKTLVVTHNDLASADVSVYEDRQGILWAGTISTGVSIAKRNSDGIRAYHNSPGDTSSLSNNSVLAFAQDSSGTVWVGTDGGGLNRFDLTTARFAHFSKKNGALNADAVLAVAAEPDGAIWIGTWGGGIGRFDPRTRSYVAYTTKNSNIPTDNIFAIHLDRRGHLWVGTWRDGLLEFDRATKSFSIYPIKSERVNEQGLKQSQIWVIGELRDGRIALGTLQQGMRIFDPATKTMTSYRSDPKDPNSLASDLINAIQEGDAGVLWIGTSEGLDRLDLRTKKFTHYGTADGILGTAVVGIGIDRKNNLWLSSDRGITRFDPATRTSTTYTTADGLQGRIFTQRAYLQGRDGMLLFGGNNGFNVIRPGSLSGKNLYAPPVVLTGFQLFNKPVAVGAPGSPLARNISETKELTLSYLQSVFTFEFAALDYTAPSKNQYQYTLEGLDDSWTHAGTTHSVTYTGLPAGHYVFRVKGSNNDGVWSEPGATLRLTITPPFWRTFWFRALVALLVVGGIALALWNARKRHLYLKAVNARLAQAAEHDRQVQQYLEGNVLDILAAMQKFAEGDYSVALSVTSDDAIGDLRRGLNGVVADLKRAEEELRQSQKMEAVGRLAGGVAHDFNNLLTVIVCNTALALDEADVPRPVAAELQEIERAAVRASALTRQLLAFSRHQILQPRLFSLNDIAEDLGRMLGRTLGEDIDLRVVVEPRLAYVRADPGQIERVLMNLVVNARDAMPRGGSLLIQTRNVSAAEASSHPEADGGAYVELMVRDAGTGMSAEVKRRIFEPFFTTKEQGKGTGLGLSTVYGIVKQSGGYVLVESETDRGTTFVVRLPQAHGAEPIPRPPEPARPPRGSGTVLLVEDEESVRGLAARVLKRGGYTVLVADCGAAALEIAEAFQDEIDIMVTDIVMPGMSGRELAERFAPLRPSLRVLFMSGYTEDAILQHGVSSDAVAFLAKPFTPDDLLRKVQHTLETPAPVVAAGAT